MPDLEVGDPGRERLSHEDLVQGQDGEGALAQLGVGAVGVVLIGNGG